MYDIDGIDDCDLTCFIWRLKFIYSNSPCDEDSFEPNFDKTINRI